MCTYHQPGNGCREMESAAVSWLTIIKVGKESIAKLLLE